MVGFLAILVLLQLLTPHTSLCVLRSRSSPSIYIEKVGSFVLPSTGFSPTALTSTKLESSLAERSDNLIEKTAIFSLSVLLATICPKPCDAFHKVGFSYQNFVQITKLLLRGRSPNAIRDSITALLTKILPTFVRDFFRDQYAKNPRVLCEMSVQWFGFGFLTWLIGPVEPQLTEVTLKDGSTEIWNSTVKLTECRYLMVSQSFSLSFSPYLFDALNDCY